MLKTSIQCSLILTILVKLSVSGVVTGSRALSSMPNKAALSLELSKITAATLSQTNETNPLGQKSQNFADETNLQDTRNNSAGMNSAIIGIASVDVDRESATESEETSAVAVESREITEGRTSAKVISTTALSLDVASSTPVASEVVSLSPSSLRPNSTSVTASSITTSMTTAMLTLTEESAPLEKSHEGMSSGIIALVMAVVFAVVVIIVYVGLLLWRRYLEYRYGNRELLVNDLEFDTNDLRHFEL